jgi:hypothetical protein
LRGTLAQVAGEGEQSQTSFAILSRPSSDSKTAPTPRLLKQKVRSTRAKG